MTHHSFDNAGDAVRFADGLLNSPHVKISMRDGVGGGNYEDLRSLAETISLELERVPKPAGPMFRYVHGTCVRRLWLADHLVSVSWPGVEGKRTVSVCRALAILVMEKNRRKANGSLLTITEIARLLHITRRVFYDRWFAIYSSMSDDTETLLNQADRALSARLEGLHIIGG
jgi:hypothetical protein